MKHYPVSVLSLLLAYRTIYIYFIWSTIMVWECWAQSVRQNVGQLSSCSNRDIVVKCCVVFSLMNALLKMITIKIPMSDHLTAFKHLQLC